MASVISIPERFHRVLDRLARHLVRGSDGTLQLAGRFGLRRYVERQAGGPAQAPDGAWLDRGARLRREARELSRLLSGVGVRHCFFKGIALLGRFYRIEERRLDDLDLLIPERDRNTVMAMLHARGYAEFGDGRSWGPSALRPGITMYRPGGEPDDPHAATLVDVHWGLEPATPLLPAHPLPIPDAVWTGIEIQGGIPVPSDEHHAALVLHHLVRHDLRHVRGLLDLALLWDALPRTAGADLTRLARELGVGRALAVVGRTLVNDLMLYPLRGVTLGVSDWRGRIAQRRWRLRDWLVWAARAASNKPRHIILTRSLAWRRYLLVDAPSAGRLMAEVLAPRREYLRWQWPRARSDAAAWRAHLSLALRS